MEELSLGHNIFSNNSKKALGLRKREKIIENERYTVERDTVENSNHFDSSLQASLFTSSKLKPENTF